MVADNPGQWPIFEEITTDFVYVRLHGHDELYASGYSDESLDQWATKIKNWTEAGQDVYVYCDNDMKVRAPYDAMGLMQRLGLTPPGQRSIDRDRSSTDSTHRLRGQLITIKTKIPRVPERAHLPLLPSSPGGVG